MKQVGIIGGTSWHSTEDIYRYINSKIEKEMGGNNCAKLIIVNVNLQEILDAPTKKEKGIIIKKAAEELERSSCDYIAICSNGLHEYEDYILSATRKPFVHIADSVADKLLCDGIHCVGFLGAKDTMEAPFYMDKLRARGIYPIVPCEEDRIFIDKVIFEEITRGIIKESSKRQYYRIAESLVKAGAEAVVLGCTEIGEIMQQCETNIKLYDTALLHAEAIANLCMREETQHQK